MQNAVACRTGFASEIRFTSLGLGQPNSFAKENVLKVMTDSEQPSDQPESQADPLFPEQSDAEPHFVTVAKVGEIPDGEGRAYPVGKRMVAVFCSEGKYFAIDDFCPHQGASLAEGYIDSESCAVACPWHHWRFSIDNGAWLDNPKIAVDKFEVRVMGENIQVAEPKE